MPEVRSNFRYNHRNDDIPVYAPVESRVEGEARTLRRLRAHRVKVQNPPDWYSDGAFATNGLGRLVLPIGIVQPALSHIQREMAGKLEGQHG
jgi:hypothetical protein